MGKSGSLITTLPTLQQRHHFPPELLPNIAGVSALFAKAVD